MKIKSLIAISLLSVSASLFAAESTSTTQQVQGVTQAQKDLNDYEKVMVEKVWVTTQAIDEKGNKVDANNPQVSNYFGLAEYYPNGTFIMFTPEGKQKCKDWSMSNDGKTRTLVAKDAQGKHYLLVM